MPQSKAQKKFEARHLKGVLERRNALKKTKQQQQLKLRKKARRAEENGIDPNDTAKKDDGRESAKEEAFKGMSVDEFFQGGFEVPELPKANGKKRKRIEVQQQEEEEDGSGSEESSVDFEEQPVIGDGEDDLSSENDEDVDGHMRQLDALAEHDPEFHKYLQENEPELLGAGLDELDGLSEDDEAPKRKKTKKNMEESEDDAVEPGRKNELTKSTITKWRTALEEQHSLRAAREVVLAFRAAAHVAEVEEEDQQFKYSISDPHVYHDLLTLALTKIPEVFSQHLPVQESKNGKVHVSLENKKFKTLGPLLKSYIGSIIHLLDHLSDAGTLRLVLTSTTSMLPYLLSFKKLARNLAKAVASHWSLSSNTEPTRLSAFLFLRRLTLLSDAGLRENILKLVYSSLISASRNTTIHTLSGVNLMKNSAAELWSLVDTSVAYTTAFTAIRQLAIHLRTAIHNSTNSKDGYKIVYNWQYTHSLDFWSRVLSSYAVDPTSHLRPLIYPLVQVTLGALRLIPTATYFPLRFHLIRSLLRLSRTTDTFIPLAAPVYEVLSSAEMRKPPKPSTLKPLDFSTAIRAPKAYLRTRTYQDGIGEQVQELLAEFFGIWSKSIAFPELSLPVIVMLKRWLKTASSKEGNKNQKVCGMVQLVVQKIEANAKFVEEKRRKVEFSPSERKGVKGFLEEVEWTKTPMGAFVAGIRRTAEEKAKTAERARVEEERRRGKDKSDGNLVKDLQEEDDDDEDVFDDNDDEE